MSTIEISSIRPPAVNKSVKLLMAKKLVAIGTIAVLINLKMVITFTFSAYSYDCVANFCSFTKYTSTSRPISLVKMIINAPSSDHN